MISFLSSAGAIKTSETLSYPDIKVGIPSTLLCIEMAIFAVLHIFAFSWRPYVNKGASGPEMQYRGGFLGFKAYIDAWNPLDIIKASARGFRWLFVGSRRRFDDPSYKKAHHHHHHLDQPPPEYTPGITFAGNGEIATEMQPQTRKPHAATAGHHRFAADDRDGLLSHVQTNPHLSPQYPPQGKHEYSSGAPAPGNSPYAEGAAGPQLGPTSMSGYQPVRPTTTATTGLRPAGMSMQGVDAGYDEEEDLQQQQSGRRAYAPLPPRPLVSSSNQPLPPPMGQAEWDVWSGPRDQRR